MSKKKDDFQLEKVNDSNFKTIRSAHFAQTNRSLLDWWIAANFQPVEIRLASRTDGTLGRAVVWLYSASHQ